MDTLLHFAFDYHPLCIRISPLWAMGWSLAHPTPPFLSFSHFTIALGDVLSDRAEPPNIGGNPVAPPELGAGGQPAPPFS